MKKGKGKAESGNGGNGKPTALKYPFATIEKGGKLVVEGADAPAGKVTRYENVRILAKEYGQRHPPIRFAVVKTEEGNIEITRTE